MLDLLSEHLKVCLSVITFPSDLSHIVQDVPKKNENTAQLLFVEFQILAIECSITLAMCYNRKKLLCDIRKGKCKCNSFYLDFIKNQFPSGNVKTQTCILLKSIPFVMRAVMSKH